MGLNDHFPEVCPACGAACAGKVDAAAAREAVECIEMIYKLTGYDNDLRIFAFRPNDDRKRWIFASVYSSSGNCLSERTGITLHAALKAAVEAMNKEARHGCPMGD